EIDIGGNGRLVVRDGSTFQPLHVMETYGLRGHEIIMTDDQTAAIANGGVLARDQHSTSEQATNITFIDLRSGRLLRKVSAPKGDGFELTHLRVTKEGIAIVGSHPNPTASGRAV